MTITRIPYLTGTHAPSDTKFDRENVNALDFFWQPIFGATDIDPCCQFFTKPYNTNILKRVFFGAL
jgi:hypothetical protein